MRARALPQAQRLGRNFDLRHQHRQRVDTAGAPVEGKRRVEQRQIFVPPDQRAARRAAKILAAGDRRILQRAHQFQRLAGADIHTHLAQQVRKGQDVGEDMAGLLLRLFAHCSLLGVKGYIHGIIALIYSIEFIVSIDIPPNNP